MSDEGNKWLKHRLINRRWLNGPLIYKANAWCLCSLRNIWWTVLVINPIISSRNWYTFHSIFDFIARSKKLPTFSSNNCTHEVGEEEKRKSVLKLKTMRWISKSLHFDSASSRAVSEGAHISFHFEMLNFFFGLGERTDKLLPFSNHRPMTALPE